MNRQLVELQRVVDLRDCIRSSARAEPAGVALEYADGRKITYSTADLICRSEHRTPGGDPVQIPLLQCPGCGAKRRSLYGGPSGLGCRGCLNLRYQSQTESCDPAVADALRERLQALARKPGPKGSRYRSWERRALRVEASRLSALLDSMHRFERAYDRAKRRRRRIRPK